MASSKSQSEADPKAGPHPTNPPFPGTVELGGLIGALSGIQDAIGNSNVALRTLLGGRALLTPVDASLNVYFARLQKRSLPRGSFRFQSSSSLSNSSGI